MRGSRAVSGTPHVHVLVLRVSGVPRIVRQHTGGSMDTYKNDTAPALGNGLAITALARVSHVGE